MTKLIVIVILLSWLITYLVNNYFKNKFIKYILPTISLLESIFSLIGIFKSANSFNEIEHYFGLFLSLISLITILITTLVMETKNTKIN